MDRVLLSSGKDDWLTPAHILDRANQFMKITFDPCPSMSDPNHVAEEISQQGLVGDWPKGHSFINPPYSVMRKQRWCRKIVQQAERDGHFLTLLVAARTDTQWFQRLIHHCQAVFFIKGRLSFSESEYAAPFPSALMYFGPPGLTSTWLDVWNGIGFGVRTGKSQQLSLPWSKGNEQWHLQPE